MKECSNTHRCTCTFSCEHHGTCCACIAYHREKGEAPGCLFSPAGEKMGDRRLETLFKDRGLAR